VPFNAPAAAESAVNGGASTTSTSRLPEQAGIIPRISSSASGTVVCIFQLPAMTGFLAINAKFKSVREVCQEENGWRIRGDSAQEGAFSYILLEKDVIISQRITIREVRHAESGAYRRHRLREEHR